MRTIEDLDITNKKVLIRADFNVPLDKACKITDDSRIQRVLPTIRYAISRGARIILASHLGRPKGSVVAEMSLSPVAARLGELIDRPVGMAPDCIGTEVQDLVASMPPGDVLLLENLRFHAEEQQNNDGFAAALATLCEVYINDAFAVSHRAHASVAAITVHV